jgi:hypothetical protein
MLMPVCCYQIQYSMHARLKGRLEVAQSIRMGAWLPNFDCLEHTRRFITCSSIQGARGMNQIDPCSNFAVVCRKYVHMNFIIHSSPFLHVLHSAAFPPSPPSPSPFFLHTPPINSRLFLCKPLRCRPTTNLPRRKLWYLIPRSSRRTSPQPRSARIPRILKSTMPPRRSSS